MSEKLCDVGSERAVLSGICQYGEDTFIDISTVLNVNTFSNTRNQLLFNSLDNLFKSGVKQVDKPSLISQINSLGFSDQLLDKQGVDYINTLFNTKIHKENIIKQAAKIATLSIARTAQSKHIEAYNNLKEITGSESIDHVLSISEKPVFDMSIELAGLSQKGPELLSENIDEYIQSLCDNPIDNIGVPTPFPIYNKIIGGGVRTGVALVAARPKALRYGSFVYTTTGPVKIENIKVGQEVLHPYQGTSKVTDVYDFQDIQIYRIYFRDGDYIDCCEDHLWKVVRRSDKKEFVKCTKDLIIDTKYNDNRYKWDICLPEPLSFISQYVPIDPYVMGVLLGDGAVSNNTLNYHTMDEEIHDYLNNYFTKLGYEVKFESKRSKASTWRVNGFQKKLRESGIFGHNCYNKFIPKNYIYNSVDVRLGVLSGLLDTDGDCTIDSRSKNSRTRFASVSKQLCLDVKEIVQSLGGLCSIVPQNTKLNGKVFPSFRCEIRLPNGINPFKLTRKRNSFSDRKIVVLKRSISKIETLCIDKARCITIDNEDGLFLTDNCLVTHNCGKTTVAKEIGIHVANLGIPVLFLDSEMNKNDQLNRSLASLSDLPITTIETGSFSKNVSSKIKVQKAAEFLKTLPYKHQRIAGKEFDEVLSIIRRWIHKDVGFSDSGKANPHLVLYDYFKLMNSSQISNSLQEYQVLGFQISKLSDFCGEYETPVLAFVQINRDGINKETSDVISGSDRLLWLCTSMSIFKRKTAEEIAEDGRENGNMKLIPVECRFGEPLEEGDYINLQMDKEKSKIKELKTQRSVVKENKDNESGFSAEAEEVLF
jgi:replicative DNA helicase